MGLSHIFRTIVSRNLISSVTIVTNAISFLAVSYVLGVSSYGIVVWILSYSMFIAQISSLSITMSLPHYYHSNSDGIPRTLVSGATIYSFLASIFFGWIALLFYNEAWEVGSGIFLITIMAGIFQVATYRILMAIALVDGSLKMYFISVFVVSTMPSWPSALYCYIFHSDLHNYLVVRSVLYLLSAILSLAFILKFTKGKWSYKLPVHILKNILSLGFKNILPAMSQTIFKINISSYLGMEALGIYGFYSRMISAIFLAIDQPIYFKVVSMLTSSKTAKRKIFSVIILSQVSMALALTLFLPYLVEKLFTKYSLDHGSYLIIFAISFTAIVISLLKIILLFFQKIEKPLFLIRSAIYGFFADVAIPLLGLIYWGLLGGVLGLAVTTFLNFMIIYLYLMYRKREIH